MFYLFEATLLYWAVTWFFFLSNLWNFVDDVASACIMDWQLWMTTSSRFLFNCYKLDFVNARTTGNLLQFGLCNNSLFERDVLVMWISYPKLNLFNELTGTLHKWHERPPNGPLDLKSACEARGEINASERCDTHVALSSSRDLINSFPHFDHPFFSSVLQALIFGNRGTYENCELSRLFSRRVLVSWSENT